MAFQKLQRYMVTFTLPDGEHILTGFSSPDVKKARENYRRVVMQNPEATFDPEKVVPIKDAAEVDAAVAALRYRDPSRPLATDLGLDTPNRVLTNPEVVPGSKVMRVDPT